MVVGVDRHEDPQPPAGRGRDDRGGERGVPAAGDGERRVPVEGGEAEHLRHLEVQRHAHQVARLVRPGHVSGLVLHPHAPRLDEAEGT